MDDLFAKNDALGVAELVRTRKLGAKELLDGTLANLRKLNGTLNAITDFYDDAAPAAEGQFQGVPYVIKQLMAECAGHPTTLGSRFFAKQPVAVADSAAVARMRKAGLVIVGRTNTSEFGLAPTTEPAFGGATVNPWRKDLSPGGSSGGSAAIVAARGLPMGHATDGGGSIRIPASACGLFGLKPTRARNPSGPDVGEGWGGQAVAHCVSLSVRDSAALLDATSGPDIGDPYWAPPPARPFLDEVGKAPGRLRIALCTRPWNGLPVDPECRQAAEDAAKLCESLGHHVTEARPEFDHAPFREAQRTLVAANVRALLVGRAAALGQTLTEDDVEPATWEVAELARQYAAEDYANAINRIHLVGRAVARFFTAQEILLTPTMCAPPLPLGVLSPENSDREAYLTAVNRSVGFTSLFNSAGNPAMSVPLHRTSAGLPVGVQFVAPFGDEAALFRLAAQLEAAKPWKDHGCSLG